MQKATDHIFAIFLDEEPNPLEMEKPLIVVSLFDASGEQRVEIGYDEAWVFSARMAELLYSIAYRNKERQR